MNSYLITKGSAHLIPPRVTVACGDSQLGEGQMRRRRRPDARRRRFLGFLPMTNVNNV